MELSSLPCAVLAYTGAAIPLLFHLCVSYRRSLLPILYGVGVGCKSDYGALVTGEREALGEYHVPMLFCPPQIPYGLTVY